MLSHEIRNKIKNIKIATKRIMRTTLSGDFLSAFKGSGLEFHHIREYQVGDDIRSIDWKSSAKMDDIMVKEFIEDRERTIIVCLDLSASNRYGSGNNLKQTTLDELAATIACIAHDNKDKIGLVCFSDIIETWMQPAKGATHLSQILQTIFTIKPKHTTTAPELPLEFLMQQKKRGAVVFMVSDWITDDQTKLERIVGIASRYYDIIALKAADPCEVKFPNIGLIDVQDPETGAYITIDARHTNHALQEFFAAREVATKRLFDKYRISALSIAPDAPFIQPLARFLQYRTRR